MANLHRLFLLSFLLSIGISIVLAKNLSSSMTFIAACRQYQNTEVTVEAIFENGVDVQRAFITDMVTLSSSDPSVASIYRGNEILGHSVGNSSVSVIVPNDKVIVYPEVVTVSSESVDLINLQVSAITDAKSTDAQGTPKDMYGLTDVGFTLSQELTSDGKSAGVSVYANFSDGSYMDVTEQATITSLNNGLLSSVDAYGPMLTVTDFAIAGRGEWVEASYPVCYRQADVVNTGDIYLDILPVRVDVVPQFHDLSNKNDYAAVFPFSLPIMTYVRVAIHFADGTVRNITDEFLPGIDSHADMVITSGNDLATLSGNLVTVTDTATNGTVMLNISFPGLYNITGSADIYVAAYEYTTVALTTFPSNPSIIKNTVYFIGCSEKRQRLQIMALGTLTNRVIKDVTIMAGFREAVTNDRTVGYTYTVKNHTMFMANSSGTIYVNAYYGPFESVWAPIHVTDERTHISAIEMLGHAPNDTMRGVANSDWSFLRIKVHFDDGTYYPEVVYGVTTQWLNVSDIIYLNSTNPSAATLDQTGAIKLIGNYYGKIFFQAFDNCTGSTVMDEVYAYSNLIPRVFDFDMGSKVGPKYGTRLVDAPFSVPIGVQSRPGLPITTFHMIMSFDPDIISVPNDDEGCLMDPSWSGYFECTTNNPANEVHIAGICGEGGCDSFDLVQFAQIDFRTKRVGTSIVTGKIVRAGDADSTQNNKTIEAGTDIVVLTTAVPTSVPTGGPSGQPTVAPTCTPSALPTLMPSAAPTSIPTSIPSGRPSVPPTAAPSMRPTFRPTTKPTLAPTATPTVAPTVQPSAQPTRSPTARPTKFPTRAPTRKPSRQPTAQPTEQPTTAVPTKTPTPEPTRKPTRMPTSSRPTLSPTWQPTEHPTERPTVDPTLAPTEHPTLEPTPFPSVSPTIRPTKMPTERPTLRPSKTPTQVPTRKPSATPTARPTAVPSTAAPTATPSARPTTAVPTRKPTRYPTLRPTSAAPTSVPSASPTVLPTSRPTSVPTSYPTGGPTRTPIQNPTSIPSTIPSSIPTSIPTIVKTPAPTLFPRAPPTFRPTNTVRPTRSPTIVRTGRPSGAPTSRPTSIPTRAPQVPSSAPSSTPTFRPTSIPSPQPTSVPTVVPTSAPTSSQPTGFPSQMPTMYQKTGYNFTRLCNEPAIGDLNVVLSGTEEICSFFPAYGDILVLVSSLSAVATQHMNYTANYSIVVTDPLGTRSWRFGEYNIPLTQAAYPYLSASTLSAPFKYWDVQYNFGSSGSYLKGSLSGSDVLSGIGLFKVCLVNLDPLDTRTKVSYSGSLLFSKTNYDCGIPLSGYAQSVSPTGSPSSSPSYSYPTSVPTSAPSYSPQKTGFNFLPKCDAAVAGDINLLDLPYMHEQCGYFPGRGLEDMVSTDLFFPQLFTTNPLHVVIRDLTNNIAFRYGDSFVNISTATGVSQLSKNAQFIPFADGLDVGLMMNRKIVMPMNGFNPISGTGWFSVCLINTGYNTSIPFAVTGGINFLNYYIDCNVMLNQPLVIPARRHVRNLLSVTEDDYYHSPDTDTVSNVAPPVAVKLLPSYYHELRAAEVRENLDVGDSTALLEHLQNTRDMFSESEDTLLYTSSNSMKSYLRPIKQNSLEVLQQLEEEDTDSLYSDPISTTFEFSPRQQSFVVPAGITTITVAACGGSGGNTARTFGGLGGCIKTILIVRPRQTLYITVGGEGQSHGVSGFHGGGIGSSATLGFASASNNAGGAGGGGASDVRLNASEISTRLVVAGGGGGGGSIDGAHGGPGGGLVGGGGGMGGSATITNKTFASMGGSQTRGGKGAKYEGSSCSFNDGYLGNGGASSLGGGGGGGYFGGGGGCYSGGAGGSNHAVGSIISNLQGEHEGAGFVRLTYNKPSRRELAQFLSESHISRVLVNASQPVVVNNGMVGMPQDCGKCVQGDINQDCVFDAQDARELEQIVTYGYLSNPSYVYTSCQRRAMDPNMDGLVNLIDVQYLLRVATKRYRFFEGLSVEYGIHIGLNINALVLEADGSKVNSSLVALSVGLMTTQGPSLELSQGMLSPNTQFPWGVQITPLFDEVTGIHTIHSDYISNEDNVAIVVTVDTFDEFGATSPSRQYTFYCSPLINKGHCVSGGGEPYEAYFVFNIWGMPTARPTAAPTISLTPTALPTSEPSGQPSGQPTANPTIPWIRYQVFEHLVHPHIDVLSGAAWPKQSLPTLASRAVWNVPFNTLMGAQPGAQSTFGLSISGRQYATSTITIARRAVAQLTAIAKTVNVYIDTRSVALAYQASDEFGGTQIETNTPLALMITNSDLHQGAQFTCLSPDPVSGIGSCVGEVSSQWWSPTATVELSARVVVLSNTTVVSNNVSFALLQEPTLLTPGDVVAPYVILTLPLRPVAPAETITVQITANTNRLPLTSWAITVVYDPLVLSFLGFSPGLAYLNPTVLHSSGRLVVSSSEVRTNASTAVNGTAVDIGSIQMRVLFNVSAGIYSDVLSSVVIEAKAANSSDLGITTNTSAWVQDIRGFQSFTSGEITVQLVSHVGVLAYATQSELLNTASFTGLVVHSAIVVEGVNDDVYSANDIVTSSAQCSARGDAGQAIDIVGHCVVQLSTSKGVGAARALVDVSHNRLNTTVPFRVWYPSQLLVQVTDPLLQRIEA